MTVLSFSNGKGLLITIAVKVYMCGFFMHWLFSCLLFCCLRKRVSVYLHVPHCLFHTCPSPRPPRLSVTPRSTASVLQKRHAFSTPLLICPFRALLWYFTIIPPPPPHSSFYELKVTFAAAVQNARIAPWGATCIAYVVAAAPTSLIAASLWANSISQCCAALPGS